MISAFVINLDRDTHKWTAFQKAFQSTVGEKMTDGSHFIDYSLEYRVEFEIVMEGTANLQTWEISSAIVC